jgi:hypothetical protein
MLVCIEIVGLTGLTLIVRLSRCDRISVCNVTLDAIRLFYEDLDLFIKVILRDGTKTPAANVIFSECKSGSSCVHQINIHCINRFPVTLSRVEGTITELDRWIGCIITAKVTLT